MILRWPGFVCPRSMMAFSLALTAAAFPARAQEEPSPPSTVITSYGEINVNRPTDRPDGTVVDLRRFVLGLEHSLGPVMRFVAELEVEHAVSSADDAGEVEIEQAYIERQLGPTWAARAGLILMPVGLLNEHHEPTAYFGVERNFVETAIIPSTWREGGLQLIGTFDSGITLQAGVTTSFDLTRWDATSTEGQQSPLGSIHQELELARAHDFGGFAAADWRGVPGLQLGAAGFAGGASQGQPHRPSSMVTLWDAHARWAPGPFDFSALYARGTLSHTAALNQPLVGDPTLIPAAYYGWYLQAACRVWRPAEMALTPFVRFERFNTGASYADLGPGLTPEPLQTESVVTAGVSFFVSPEVVLKADYQRFEVETHRDRVDLGLGWSF
jgi:hypothetical protein